VIRTLALRITNIIDPRTLYSEHFVFVPNEETTCNALLLNEKRIHSTRTLERGRISCGKFT